MSISFTVNTRLGMSFIIYHILVNRDIEQLWVTKLAATKMYKHSLIMEALTRTVEGGVMSGLDVPEHPVSEGAWFSSWRTEA